MVLLRVLRWLLRPVWSLFHALFGLVWPRRGADTQHGENICLTQRTRFQAVMKQFKGLVLKPAQKTSKDQITEMRSVIEVQGISDTIKKTGLKRMSSRSLSGENVEEAELSAPKAQVTSPPSWLAEIGNVPVLRRLKQNH
ncbi:uncharacterized protein Hap1MRO34_006176 [Clarias gariepinus]